ncbi:ParM/StbA family protein [Clostridium sporogenes]|uniref:ParM/StbA family protein n=1 Tax=Clostridium sporogenes TaxID=1509 RepID=UPI000717B4EC|nr:ParM/StbA family protein [Clostridium sporogenes]KRU40012.1 StbA protein [Clostridium sporogenes]MBY7065171.1 ParM/StbA family protein [Clostridium sporogenes]MBY7071859.1 ParM/StbA family protein [Clostridium sporogenes]MCW6064759.1 ParM/StbA family protein [Clostridium sporogenes]OQP88514.1 StbA protein [Clostridium sporogenes]
MKILLSVDAGKNTFKAIGKEIGTEDVKKISFPSKYNETKDINEEYEGNSHMIILDDTITILGDAGLEYDYDSDKEKDIHKLSTYIAITQLLEPNEPNKPNTENEVYMVLACPIDFIATKELKDNYKEFIGNKGNLIKVNADGKDYSFTIKDITVKQEGAGVIFNNAEKYMNKEVALIDLGGVNFSFCIYNNCIPVKNTRFARDFGGNYLNNITVNALRGFTKGKAITSQLALQSLIEDCLTLANVKDSKSMSEIQKIKTKYLTKIVDEIKKAGQSIEVVEPVFCGGTTSLIKETILREIPHAIVVDNPQWESVQGLFIVANSKYNKIL